MLPYGMAPDGRLLHISEVSSGLGCGCVCPACRGPLVANKGTKKTHHFAHHSIRDCVEAYETMLHLLAKQVIAERKLVMLPAVQAEYKGLRSAVHPGKEFRPDEVVVEVWLKGMRPDVVARITRKGQTKELLIEVAVTHFCESEKIGLIRARRMAGIEIDLSRMPRNVSRKEMEDAIIASAPRRWLFNNVQEQRVEQLRAEFERSVAEEREREQRIRRLLDAQARELVAYFRETAAALPRRRAPAEQKHIDRVHSAGLAGLVGVELAGGACFAVVSEAWQSFLLDRFILGDKSLFDTVLTSAEALSLLRRRGLVHPRFVRPISDNLAKATRALEPGFQSPEEVVKAYLGSLTERHILRQQRYGWSRDTSAAQEAQKRLRKIDDGLLRVAELKRQLNVLRSLPSGCWVDVRWWLQTAHHGLEKSPAALAMAGGWAYDSLIEHLDRLKRMNEAGAPVEKNLLGLPLEEQQELRREEHRLAQKAARLAAEERARKAAEERREVEALRRSALIKHVIDALGDMDGAAWLERPLRSLGNAAISALGGLSEEQDRSARLELLTEQERRSAVAHQKADIQTLQDELRNEAIIYRDPRWADHWMNAINRGLDSRRPKDVCVDAAGLAKCRAALKQEGRRRRA
ncbi:competence protein CoiA family protein [Sorangium sp. So ce1014]|uniref:competence protein CoiA family protein n=1 Tax=Sorangium sp. So ce1014 TaxID=3133326 RepID=UPI003F609B2B